MNHITIYSKRLGAVPYNPGDVIHFPQGIPAFEESHRFVIVEQDRLAPISFLQSIDTPTLSLPLIEACHVFPEYQLALSAEDRLGLGLIDGQHSAELRTLLVLAHFESQVTLNLAAPIVIHAAVRRGVQAVRADRVYSAVQPLASLRPALLAC
jgi:flagellar assembly factor FliW